MEDKVNEVAAESQNNEVKVQFADEQAAPLTPLEEVETEDDENRNKRFLSGLGGSSSSGNFVFDIIRVSFPFLGTAPRNRRFLQYRVKSGSGLITIMPIFHQRGGSID